MKKPWLHRFAILVIVLMFLLIGAGAALTSNIRGLPGTNPGPVGTAPGLRQFHVFFAVGVALLTVALAIFVRSTMGWIALAAVIVEGGLGSYGAIAHAIVAPILFAGLVAIAVQTSDSWSRPPVPANDLWPPLRTMSILAPILVVVQIILGAAFRHNATGVVWHILDAGIVLLLIMVLGMCVVRQFPEHPSLSPAAVWLLVITGVQVLLGFTVYMVILIVSANNATLIVSSVLHVMTGALTLAASVVMLLAIKRCDAPLTARV
jgi:heme A synthase